MANDVLMILIESGIIFLMLWLLKLLWSKKKGNLKACNYCNYEVAPTAEVCPKCGTRLRPHPIVSLLVSVYIKIPVTIMIILVIIGVVSFITGQR